MVWKKAIRLIFTILLVIMFVLLFGKPAIDKFLTREVFIKVSTDPKDRSQVSNIRLPAVTVCASDASSIIFQVERVSKCDSCPSNYKYLISQGWRKADMDYTDLVNNICGNRSNIEQCILDETFSQSEMILSVSKGTNPDGSGCKLNNSETLCKM